MTNTFTQGKQNAPVTTARGFPGILPAFALYIVSRSNPAVRRQTSCALLYTETSGDHPIFFMFVRHIT